MDISDEVRAKLKLWNQRTGPHPSWYVWTGGWYENNGEANYYTNHPLNVDSIVFDVGGYEGEWTSRIIRKYNCTVYLFEPSTRAFQVAQKRLGIYTNVILCPFALGASTGILPLGDSNRDSASFLTTLSPIVQAKKIDIVEVCKSFRVDAIDLMSVNIEGGEFELLPHIISSGLVSSIRRFMIQWHSVVPDYDYRQFSIQEQLSLTHKMVWNLSAWEAWDMI